MKKWTKVGMLCGILGIFLMFSGGCASSKESEAGTMPAGGDSAKKTVTVTTTFLMDMTETIAGDTVNIEQIIPAGSDPHLYIAKPQDYDKFSEADLVLYHGLHFEGKMTEFLEKEGHAVSMNFPKEMLIFEGEGEAGVDPHFWFNVDLYILAARECTDALSALVPERAAEYEENFLSYEKELKDLDTYIRTELEKIPEQRRYLITPHDAFQYFSKKYDIVVMAPQGTNTGSEVSNGDIQETIDFIVAHDIRAVFAETTTDPARMEKLREGVEAKGKSLTIVRGEGQELFSDSLGVPGEEGDTYIKMVKHNVDLIVQYLSEP